MKRFSAGLIAGILVGLLVGMAGFAGASSPIRLLINGKYVQCDVPPQNINGRVMVPARYVAEGLGATVSWDQANQTVIVNGPGYSAPTGSTSTSTSSSSKEAKLVNDEWQATISKADLPFTLNAKNGISLTINSVSASTGGIKMNITLKNNSTVSDKGGIMTSTWEFYDGKSTIKFLNQDQIFYTSYLRCGQAITGDVNFAGLSNSTSSIILYGGLWQYIDKEGFKITINI